MVASSNALEHQSELLLHTDSTELQRGFGWHSVTKPMDGREDLCKCLVIQKNLKPMTACEPATNVHSFKISVGIVSSASKISTAKKTVLPFAETFAPSYNFCCTEANTKNIGAETEVSDFLSRASVATCKRHIWVAKTTLQSLQCWKSSERRLQMCL